LDSGSEQTQPEEKKEEDFFTTSLSADNSNNSDETDSFKAQTPEVSFSAFMVVMKYFFVVLFRKVLGHNNFPYIPAFRSAPPSHPPLSPANKLATTSCLHLWCCSLVYYLLQHVLYQFTSFDL